MDGLFQVREPTLPSFPGPHRPWVHYEAERSGHPQSGFVGGSDWKKRDRDLIRWRPWLDESRWAPPQANM
jgi:hypothetical protein